MQDFTPRQYQKIIEDHILDNPRCAVWASMGLGKLQSNSEPVLTPTGWRAIGTLNIDDYVIGADGFPTKVLAVFPQGEKEIYRVTFNDGSWTRVGLEHLWLVKNAQQRYAGTEGQVLTTASLLAAGIKDRFGNSKWFIPLCAPVQGPTKELPLDPYVLGVILGDGHVAANGNTNITTEDAVTKRWPGGTRPHKSRGISTKNLSGVRAIMRGLGLAGCRSWEKFVPEVYLRGHAEQRLLLLQGLLDTDGHAIEGGGVEFSSTSERLIDAVVELANSLGGVARKSKRRRTTFQNGIGRVSWRVNVKLPSELNPFRLKRKLDAWVRPTKYQPARAIASIKPDGVEHATCISVAAQDGLYLTRFHLVTHNTSATISAIQKLLLIDGGPVLVLAPLRVAKTTWPAELNKWAQFSKLKISCVIGSSEERVSALRVKADIYTTNYDNLVWLVELLGDKWPFKIVVADESTRLKSFRVMQGGKRAQALGRVAHTKIKRFIELTGTPTPNGLLDLWGQVWFLDFGERLGRSFQACKERWFLSNHSGYGYTCSETSQREIHSRMRDIAVTIDAKDWFDVKEPIVSNVYVELPPRARQMYRGMEKEMFMLLETHEIEAFNAAARTQKLLQLASGAVYLNQEVDSDGHKKAKEWKKVHDEKLDALDEIIDSAQGAPILIAYHFKSDLIRLKERYKKKATILGSDTKTIDDWNAGKIPLLLAHPQSAGHGLNLQDGGNILVFFSHNWALEDRLQIIERIGPVRQLQAGHDRPVYIYNIIARGTADEMVIERVANKKSVQDILLDAMKAKY